jgi:glyoxylase-like metal-dependent hydrolase (beta-lactamase superfamily II)
LPYQVQEVSDLATLDAGDVPVRAVHTPGPRPDHLAFIVGDGAFILAGDLDGVRGARSVTGPPDPAAWAASRSRLAALASSATWLTGHPGEPGASRTG